MNFLKHRMNADFSKRGSPLSYSYFNNQLP